MDEERLNEETIPEISGGSDQIENEIAVEPAAEETDMTVNETEAEPDPLRRDTKEALIIGAALGLTIGLLMFFVPNKAMEEGARLTISVILILLGPRFVQDKYHIDFSKGRFTMAAALILVLIIYIAIGHPIN